MHISVHNWEGPWQHRRALQHPPEPFRTCTAQSQLHQKLPQVPLGIPPFSLTHQAHLARSSGCSPRSDISCHKVPLSRTLIQMRWQRPVNLPKKPQTRQICSKARCSESPQPELMPRGECQALCDRVLSTQ